MTMGNEVTEIFEPIGYLRERWRQKSNIYVGVRVHKSANVDNLNICSYEHIGFKYMKCLTRTHPNHISKFNLADLMVRLTVTENWRKSSSDSIFFLYDVSSHQ